MPESPDGLDSIDRQLLDLLSQDARQSAAEIAQKIDLSATAVRRRIARLEDDGVIVTYTAVLDHSKVEPSLEAYVELDLTPHADVQAFLEEAVEKPEVREASALAGHPDAILRMRVYSVTHLRSVVTDLRKSDLVAGSKTMVALGRLRHVSKRRGR